MFCHDCHSLSNVPVTLCAGLTACGPVKIEPHMLAVSLLVLPPLVGAEFVCIPQSCFGNQVAGIEC